VSTPAEPAADPVKEEIVKEEPAPEPVKEEPAAEPVKKVSKKKAAAV
jgi:hypothetical protein